MNFRDYLAVAATLARGKTEAEWRSATSRAYYAAFHAGRQFLLSLQFRVPKADRAHAYVWMRLSNAGDAGVCHAGSDLSSLRGYRNEADYDELPPQPQGQAQGNVALATAVLQALDAALIEPIRTQVMDTIKIYERDILQDVTWHP